MALTGGIAEVDVIGGDCMTCSQNFACPEHGISISDLSPRLFSFNNPLGACEKCTGLGTFMRVDEERILPNRNLSIREGAIKASGWYYAEAVSYTHLDVYKRQPVEDMKKAYELGSYINLDDATMVEFLERVAGVPENIFCRYNPGRCV